jgi:DegV family protein with EDD domain
MAKIKVVTDGAADIPLDLARELGIEVAPLIAHVDDKLYRVGLDISDEQLYELMGAGHPRIRVSAPSSTVIEQLYRGLIGDVDHIFSIHLGTRLGTIHGNAAQARARLPASTTKVELIDSKSASMGLGSVVLAAAHAARDGASPMRSAGWSTPPSVTPTWSSSSTPWSIWSRAAASPWPARSSARCSGSSR